MGGRRPAGGAWGLAPSERLILNSTPLMVPPSLKTAKLCLRHAVMSLGQLSADKQLSVSVSGLHGWQWGSD